MKAITKYQANDGVIFDEELKCVTYEQQLLQIDSIMRFMGKKPKDKGCEFANGGGYIQHDVKQLKQATNQLVILSKAILGIKEDVEFGWIDRYFDDSNNRALYAAWSRLSNCDEQGREWGQDYYAINPEKGVQKPFVEN